MAKEDDYPLIVEDVPDILELLRETLKFKGYRVVTAENGEEALVAIAKEKPALIVTDILMPKMDGFNLVHRLRLDVETRSIPVIFLTATYVAPEDREFALTIGVSRFMEKPVNLAEFFPLIEELLENGPAAAKPLNEREFYEDTRNAWRSRSNTRTPRSHGINICSSRSMMPRSRLSKLR